MQKSNLGVRGEQCAAEYLRKMGFEILFQNFHTRFGEIDIIASNAQYIVFAEVKSRTPSAFGRPCEAVDRNKQAKLIKTALLFLSEYHTELQPRFDVLEILNEKDNVPRVCSHIENAFWVEE